jgi:hypothetical protein
MRVHVGKIEQFKTCSLCRTQCDTSVWFEHLIESGITIDVGFLSLLQSQ